MVYILNFNNSRNLEDIKYYYDTYEGTNLNFLLNGFSAGKTNWSVPKEAVPGDTVLFMCAKEARHNLGLATSHIPDSFGQKFQSFVDQQKSLYKNYSGYLFGTGVISSTPVLDTDFNWFMADINQLRKFPVPVHMDEFRPFISISRLSSITYLKDDQWERLKWLINQKNSGFFQNVTIPDKETLEQEFENEVKKEEKKQPNALKKAAEKAASQPVISTVQAKVYHRSPAIAAYVKKRANGICQLCGSDAPFTDLNGDPYLECHHIVWLSKGGMDSVDNCVALCPNCHRKMHLINDVRDVNMLKAKI